MALSIDTHYNYDKYSPAVNAAPCGIGTYVCAVSCSKRRTSVLVLVTDFHDSATYMVHIS